MKTILLILFCSLLLVSCDKEKFDRLDLNNSTLIFGHFFSECEGEGCIEIFKLGFGNLYEDTLDIINVSGFHNGSYKELSKDKFILTNDLLLEFPQELFDEKNNVLGMPDAGDWGGFYVEFNDGRHHRSWLIDMKKTNVPAKYHNFMDKMNEKISMLQ